MKLAKATAVAIGRSAGSGTNCKVIERSRLSVQATESHCVFSAAEAPYHPRWFAAFPSLCGVSIGLVTTHTTESVRTRIHNITRPMARTTDLPPACARQTRTLVLRCNQVLSARETELASRPFGHRAHAEAASQRRNCSDDRSSGKGDK